MWGDQSPHAPRIAKGPRGDAAQPFRNSWACEAWCVVFGLAFLWVWVFFVGGPVPPRPPKCALKGAFHEVVRLGVSCLAWPFGGFGEAFRVWPGPFVGFGEGVSCLAWAFCGFG